MQRTRPHYALIAVLAALCAVAIARPSARAGVERQDELSADELSRLGAGELVERRITRRQGDMRLMGGTSWQVIDAAPEIVWQALRDTPYYPRMLPQLSEARVVSDTGLKRKLFMRHGGLAQTSYYLDVRFDEATHELTFRVDDSRPSGIRAAWGFYAVRPYEGGRTLLVFGVMADIGDGLGTTLVRGTVHEWMMKVPWMVKRFVEGSGRYIYSRAPARERGVAVH